MSLNKLKIELADILEEAGKDFVQGQAEHWKAFSKAVAQDFAKEAFAARQANTIEERKMALESLEFLAADVHARIATAQLDLVDQGAKTLEKVLSVAAKVLISFAI